MNNRLIIAILTLAVLALLTGHFVIGLDYLEQRQAHDELNALISEAAQVRAQTPGPEPDLQARLAAAEAELIVARTSSLSDINSTSLINDILLLAEECQVSVIPLVTRPWDEVSIGRGYEVFRLNLTVSGDFANLHKFIYRLESGDFAALATEDLSVTRSDAAEADSAEVKASLDVAVYSQPSAAAEGASP